MATPVHTVTGRTLSAAAIRDVCARPAVLLTLADAVPAGAVTCSADRRRAVADGVARALELALTLADGHAPTRHDAPLLEEADRRLWEPVTVDLARLLQRTGTQSAHLKMRRGLDCSIGSSPRCGVYNDAPAGGSALAPAPKQTQQLGAVGSSQPAA